jgi:hypothetical protein
MINGVMMFIHPDLDASLATAPVAPSQQFCLDVVEFANYRKRKCRGWK